MCSIKAKSWPNEERGNTDNESQEENDSLPNNNADAWIGALCWNVPETSHCRLLCLHLDLMLEKCMNAIRKWGWVRGEVCSGGIAGLYKCSQVGGKADLFRKG